MKIAFYIGSLKIGGAETIVTNYLLELKKSHDVILIEDIDKATFLSKRIKEADIKVYNLLPESKSWISRVYIFYLKKLFYQRKIVKIIRKEKVDIFHNHRSFELFSEVGLPANRIFYSFHTDIHRNIEMFGESHKKAIERLANRGMHLLVLSEKMRQDAQEYFQNADIHVLQNGIDIDEIRKNRYDKESFMKSLGLNTGYFVLGHVARYNAIKNHEKVFSIFSSILKHKSDSYLFLVGSGSNSEIKRINKLILESGLQNNVIVFGVREDATAIISTCDAFVLPSYVEGFSLVLAEAQVLGVRSVVSAAVPDEVICNANCFKFDINETDDEWAALILSSENRTFVKDVDYFSIHFVIDNLLKFYIKAIDNDDVQE